MSFDSSEAQTPTSVDPDAVTTSSLQALQSDDQRKVMDIVDKLRRTGLNGIVELPQLVVCGDQSSGKSSVLEAITEIPFPRKENLCTRFATEIILRRSANSLISVTITPDKLRPKSEQEKLKSFKGSIEDFSQLPVIIEEATVAMGLGAVGAADSRAFSRDVLSIQIDGPERPQLTVVDLPGLIHSTNRAQTEADKDLILDLVKEYMKNERTIILAIVSAKNDFANQVVLDHARKVDAKGNRTLGIITKPDYLREGSDNELSWIELAQNKDIYLKNGWHMLRNRGEEEGGYTFAQRNESEKIFFSKGRYADIARDCVGIESLRVRLSKLLLNHLIKELPSLKREMDGKLQETMDEIEKLGESRGTLEQQRRALMKISMSFHNILKAANMGYYESPFFGAVDLEKGINSPENNRRFRAVVQHLNLKFAENMHKRGNKYMVERGPDEEEEQPIPTQKLLTGKEDDKDEWGSFLLPSPQNLTRKEAVEWVKKTLVRTRGHELPGTFQPMLISQLFWEQSQPWEVLAKEHIRDIARACKEFVYAALNYTAPQEFIDRLAGVSVDAALQTSFNNAQEELTKLLKDKSRHPMTYNHYFTTTIQKQRTSKYQKAKDAVKDSQYSTVENNQKIGLSKTNVIDQAMDALIEQDMDTFSAEDALNSARAYYKDELKYFINAVCKTVIERHLVEPLPDIILSPLVVDSMTEKQISFVAAEPYETTQQRKFLENRKAMLEKGLETFREAMGGLRR